MRKFANTLSVGNISLFIEYVCVACVQKRLPCYVAAKKCLYQYVIFVVYMCMCSRAICMNRYEWLHSHFIIFSSTFINVHLPEVKNWVVVGPRTVWSLLFVIPGCRLLCCYYDILSKKLHVINKHPHCGYAGRVV